MVGLGLGLGEVFELVVVIQLFVLFGVGVRVGLNLSWASVGFCVGVLFGIEARVGLRVKILFGTGLGVSLRIEV